MNAIFSVNKLRYEELHENEVPIAMITYQQAEMNRDRKKQKEAYKLEDFFCYPTDKSTKDTIDTRYGVATRELIKMGRFPSWALFVYKELMKNVKDSSIIPRCLSYICEEDDVILLAPEVINAKQVRCMLIALESSSGMTRKFREITSNDSDNNSSIRVLIPRVNSKIIAQENITLEMLLD